MLKEDRKYPFPAVPNNIKLRVLSGEMGDVLIQQISYYSLVLTAMFAGYLFKKLNTGFA
jgi:hypothetical protein